MTTQQPHAHPIVELVIQGLRQGGCDGYALGVDQLRAIQGALSAIKVVSEARRAVRELIQFAWLLETRQRSPKLARALVASIREAVVILAARDARFAGLLDQLEMAAAKFARFNGDPPARRPPHADERRAANTLSVAALAPVMLR